MHMLRKLRAVRLFVGRQDPSSFRANSDCSVIHGRARERALARRSERDRVTSTRLHDLPSTARKDSRLLLGTMSSQLYSE